MSMKHELEPTCQRLLPWRRGRPSAPQRTALSPGPPGLSVCAPWAPVTAQYAAALPCAATALSQLRHAPLPLHNTSLMSRNACNQAISMCSIGPRACIPCKGAATAARLLRKAPLPLHKTLLVAQGHTCNQAISDRSVSVCSLGPWDYISQQSPT